MVTNAPVAGLMVYSVPVVEMVNSVPSRVPSTLVLLPSVVSPTIVSAALAGLIRTRMPFSERPSKPSEVLANPNRLDVWPINENVPVPRSSVPNWLLSVIAYVSGAADTDPSDSKIRRLTSFSLLSIPRY